MKPTANAMRRAWTNGLRLWETHHLEVVVIAFWISITSYLISTAWDLGVADVIIGLAGTASCGFSWLFARALFRADAEREIWPVLVVGGLIVTGLILSLYDNNRQTSGLMGSVLNFSKGTHGLISSTVLFLAFIEAFLGFRADLPKTEKRFRICYAAGYGGLLTVSVLWLNGVPDGSQAALASDSIKMICAMLAIVLSIWAWRYRTRHLLPRPKRRQRRLGSVSRDDQFIADQILLKFENDKLFLEPDLKLKDLARKLGEADHRVSKCITGVLGFPNFNALVNKYRIDVAKRALVDADAEDVSVLSVALDSGFSSIGPFNRAFKNQTGQTPSEYRRSHRRS
ncbi:MAG: AraC family transcriptional regulator [Pseudomonadota bacterium]